MHKNLIHLNVFVKNYFFDRIQPMVPIEIRLHEPNALVFHFLQSVFGLFLTGSVQAVPFPWSLFSSLRPMQSQAPLFFETLHAEQFFVGRRRGLNDKFLSATRAVYFEVS